MYHTFCGMCDEILVIEQRKQSVLGEGVSQHCFRSKLSAFKWDIA